MKITREKPTLRKTEYELEEDELQSELTLTDDGTTPVCLICRKTGNIFTFIDPDVVGVFCSPGCEERYYQKDFDQLQEPKVHVIISKGAFVCGLSLLALTLALAVYSAMVWWPLQTITLF